MMWDSALPKLCAWLQKNEETFNGEVWEDLILRLLSETVKLINDNEWTVNLGRHYVQQIKSYEENSNLKKCLLKQLGIVLQKTTHKDFIRETLAVIFDSTNHTNSLQKRGCAQAFGYCSTTHLDTTLECLGEKLNAKNAPKKGFFDKLFSKDASNEGQKNTIFLCYGYVAGYGPIELITSRVDVHILSPTKEHVTTAVAGPESVRVSLVKMFNLLGKAMHPSHLKKPYILLQRDYIVRSILQFIGGQVSFNDDPKNKGKSVPVSSNVSNKLRALGLECISTLVRLEPAIPQPLEADVLASVKKFYDLTLEQKKGGKEAAKEEKEENHLANVFVRLNDLYTSLIFMNTSLDQTSRILENIADLAGSTKEVHRHRSVESFLSVLQHYIETKLSEANLSKGIREQQKKFANLGKFLGVLIPRCCDPSVTVRQSAMECIQNLLYIDFFTKKEAESPELLKGLQKICTGKINFS